MTAIAAVLVFGLVFWGMVDVSRTPASDPSANVTQGATKANAPAPPTK